MICQHCKANHSTHPHHWGPGIDEKEILVAAELAYEQHVGKANPVLNMKKVISDLCPAANYDDTTHALTIVARKKRSEM